MDVALSDIRVRSKLLAAVYPQTTGDAALQVLLDDAASGFMSLTGRAIGVAPGTEGPYACTLMEVPPALRAIARRVLAVFAERLHVSDLSEGARLELLEAQQSGGLSSFTAGPYCVPMSTEALTDRGWRSYGDLCVGDMVLGFDPMTEKARWTPILELVAPVEADIVRFGNKQWSMRCTPNHRWITRDRYMSGPKRTGHYAAGPWRLRTVDALRGKREYDVLTAAPAATEHQLDITPSEAATIAWLWTDGHVEVPTHCSLPFSPAIAQHGQRTCGICGRSSAASGKGKWKFCSECAGARREQTRGGTSIRGHIVQKKYGREVEATLALAEAPYRVAETDVPGCLRYRLASPWLADLWERARLYDLSPVEFVLRLGPEAREAFVEAGVLAEGHRVSGSRGRPVRSWAARFYRQVFSQNEGPVLDAFALAAQLSGYGVRVKGEGRKVLPGWGKPGAIREFLFARPFQGGQKMTSEPQGRELVWCVRTELGSWTIRQGDAITLTGNSEAYFSPQAASQVQALDSDQIVARDLWGLATDCVRAYWFRLWRPGSPLPPASSVMEFAWDSGAWSGGYWDDVY